MHAGGAGAEVVLPAEQVVVDPRGIGPRRVESSRILQARHQPMVAKVPGRVMNEARGMMTRWTRMRS